MTKNGYRKLNHIHMVGIGGTGMNGIAEVLLNLGYKVSGSDIQENDATRRLVRARGRRSPSATRPRTSRTPTSSSSPRPSARTTSRSQEARRLHDPGHPPGRDAGRADADAVRHRRGRLARQDDDDLHDRARPRGRPGSTRPSSSAAGSNTLGANARLGAGRLHRGRGRRERPLVPLLSPFIAVLTNIDDEHLDQYQGVDDLKKTFVDFANKVPFYCPVILCLDDPNLQRIIPQHRRAGSSPTASRPSPTCRARDIALRRASRSAVDPAPQGPGSSATLQPARSPARTTFSTPWPPSPSASTWTSPPDASSRPSPATPGRAGASSSRRDVGGIMVIEDYGHHPTEIQATLDGGQAAAGRGALVAVFQPHRYTRAGPAAWTSFATGLQPGRRRWC
ncbi:MAG: Mur ligase domain-containing protein [Desulfomicrobium escambiense]|nr:Mur ligase domain-containing protein [Desulfomicrobium escambiense]